MKLNLAWEKNLWQIYQIKMRQKWKSNAKINKTQILIF